MTNDGKYSRGTDSDTYSCCIEYAREDKRADEEEKEEEEETRGSSRRLQKRAPDHVGEMTKKHRPGPEIPRKMKPLHIVIVIVIVIVLSHTIFLSTFWQPVQ